MRSYGEAGSFPATRHRPPATGSTGHRPPPPAADLRSLHEHDLDPAADAGALHVDVPVFLLSDHDDFFAAHEVAHDFRAVLRLRDDDHLADFWNEHVTLFEHGAGWRVGSPRTTPTIWL